MSELTENSPEVLRFIADMIERGQFIAHSDGTFSLGHEMQEKLRQLIDKHPEAYAKIFPDRLQ